MENEVYGTTSIVVSRVTNQSDRDDAIYESECEINTVKIDKLLSDFLEQQLGLKVHNVNIEWENFYDNEEESK